MPVLAYAGAEVTHLVRYIHLVRVCYIKCTSLDRTAVSYIAQTSGSEPTGKDRVFHHWSAGNWIFEVLKNLLREPAVRMTEQPLNGVTRVCLQGVAAFFLFCVSSITFYSILN